MQIEKNFTYQTDKFVSEVTCVLDLQPSNFTLERSFNNNNDNGIKEHMRRSAHPRPQGQHKWLLFSLDKGPPHLRAIGKGLSMQRRLRNICCQTVHVSFYDWTIVRGHRGV